MCRGCWSILPRLFFEDGGTSLALSIIHSQNIAWSFPITLGWRQCLTQISSCGNHPMLETGLLPWLIFFSQVCKTAGDFILLFRGLTPQCPTWLQYSLCFWGPSSLQCVTPAQMTTKSLLVYLFPEQRLSFWLSQTFILNPGSANASKERTAGDWELIWQWVVGLVIEWMFISPTKSMCWHPKLQCYSIWRWGFGEVIRVRWHNEGGPSWWD